MTSETTYGGTPKPAIERHYDVGNEFWRHWLDSSMAYSSAMWEPGDTLDTAQTRKFDYLIEGARAPGSARVLDIGCGWGGMMRRMVDAHGVRQAVGVTLSSAQQDWIRGWDDSRVEVRLENWADHEPEAPYDALVSAGAFEHFARADDPRERNVEAYRDFFRFCHRVLKPAGWLGLQTICKGNARLDREAIDNARFIWKHIFNESEVPWVADVAQASEKRFETFAVRNDPDDYRRTAIAWREGLNRNRDEIIALVGEET